MNYSIAVKVDISDFDYNPVLKYYNEKREKDSPELEELDRMEGGFKIKLPANYYNDYHDDPIDPDCKIAQLRWNRRRQLIPGYIGFNNKEKSLLFESLCHVLGEDNVYYVSKEDTSSNPHIYHVSVTPNGHVVKGMI